MDGLRDWYEGLEPWQRGVVAVLLMAVGVAAAVLVVALALQGGGDAPQGTSTTVIPPSTGSTEATGPPTSETSTTTTPSTTTTEPTTTSSEETTTTTDPLAALTLDPDGIGGIGFGTAAGEAIERLEAVLGDPDADTGWLDKDEYVETYGTCVGETVRFVRWGSLSVFLTDGATPWQPAGSRHFASYVHSPEVGEPVLDLATEEGVVVGTTVDQLRATYGDRVQTSDDPLFGPIWELSVTGAGSLGGLLSGLDGDDVVESIGSGESCGL